MQDILHCLVRTKNQQPPCEEISGWQNQPETLGLVPLNSQDFLMQYTNDRTAKTTRPDWSELYPPQKGSFLI